MQPGALLLEVGKLRPKELMPFTQGHWTCQVAYLGFHPGLFLAWMGLSRQL